MFLFMYIKKFEKNIAIQAYISGETQKTCICMKDFYFDKLLEHDS